MNKRNQKHSQVSVNGVWQVGVQQSMTQKIYSLEETDYLGCRFCTQLNSMNSL